MDTQKTPVDERTLARVDAIAEFVRTSLVIESVEDVTDTLHAFLVLYAMNAKLVGMAKADAVSWVSYQWDSVEIEGESINLAQLPCSSTRH